MAYIPEIMMNGFANIKPEEAINKDNPQKKSLIQEYFTKNQIKMLYYLCGSVDFADNNDKADIIKNEILDDSFIEIGVGTNRATYLKNGFICKIACDYRGLKDNFTEYKRSIDSTTFFPKTYETNMLVSIAEYVNVFDKESFILNKTSIMGLIEEISKRYIHTDIGYQLKNHYNFGYRDNGEIVILDYGYVYPKKEEYLICPRCRNVLNNNSIYSAYVCSNCRTSYSGFELVRMHKRDLEDPEDAMLMKLSNSSLPDFNKLLASLDMF